MKLEEFLVEAKINTYASEGEFGETKLVDGSKELRFGKCGFKYRDRYFGSDFFVGEEVVFENEKPIWGMNYYGKATSDIRSSIIYDFLKEALKRVTPEKPFRGPDSFKSDDWEYVNRSKGNVEQFIGEEQVLFKGEIVYKLNYHGGLIQK